MIVPYFINGALPCEDNNPSDELHNSDYFYTPGILKSYKWELDTVTYHSSFKGFPLHSGVVRYIKFPLLDKLHITFIRGDYINEEIWEVFNWQIKERPFNIVDFISIGYPNNHPTGHAPIRLYQGEVFKLASIETFISVGLT